MCGIDGNGIFVEDLQVTEECFGVQAAFVMCQDGMEGLEAFLADWLGHEG